MTKIRAYQPDDAAALAKIFQRAIRQLGARDYTADQIKAWAGLRVTAGNLNDKYADGRSTFIAVDTADQPVAFCDLEADGHIDMLYCDPGHAGRGVASRLLAAVEREARSLGLQRLHTEASETARPVFERAGFVAVLRRELDVGGVALHNWKMEKQL
jgi:putative acetyltransferase